MSDTFLPESTRFSLMQKGKKKFVCPCGKAVSSSSSLSRHRRTHVIYSKRRFGCPYEGCKHRSNQRNGLKSHIEHNHKQTGFDQPDVQGSVHMDHKAGVVAVEGNADHWRIYPSNLLEQFETFAFQSSAAIQAASGQAFEPSSSTLSPPFDNAMQYVDLRHAFEMNSSALPMPDYATLGGINYPTDVRIGCPSRGDEKQSTRTSTGRYCQYFRGHIDGFGPLHIPRPSLSGIQCSVVTPTLAGSE